MIYTPGIAVSQMSGSLGGVTASRNRGGQYFRDRAIPVTNTSTYAMNVKARLAQLSQAWAALTAAQRQAWTQWAQQNPIVNALGFSITKSGHQSYVGINSRLLADSQAALADPPISAAPAGLLTLTQTADIGSGTFTLAYTATPLGATVKLWIRAAVEDSAGVNFVRNRLKFVGTSAAAETSPFDYQSLVETRFGTLIVGQTVHVDVATFDTATGLLSPGLVSKLAVTDTP